MGNDDVWALFQKFNQKYFWSKLNKVKVSWSPHMTLCAGKTAFKVWRSGGTSCSIRLSQPLLSQRPHSDTINTLLHEMIHAYLHVTQGLKYRDSHGPEFRSHMKRINAEEGSKITIFHKFEKEVNKFRIHVYRCDGPCVSRRPYFGILRRAIERPPGPSDRWWARHEEECGGTFHKIEGPGAKPTKGRASLVNNKMQKNTDSKYSTPRNSSPNARVNNMGRGSDNKYSNLNSNYASRKSNFNDMNVGNSIQNNYHRQTSGGTSKNTTFDESSVLERIRYKYSNVKQTKLLSKEVTEKLIKDEVKRSLYRDGKPFNQKGGSSYPHPAPFGNFVEAKVNYSYQGHSPKQIKLAKYLRRFQEAKQSLDPLSCSPLKSNRSKSSDRCQDRTKLKASSTSESLINYNYCPNTPSKIKLDKYLERYKRAVTPKSSNIKTKSPSPEDKQERVMHFPENTRKSSSSERPQPMPGTSKTTQCPICSLSIDLKDYDDHLGNCFGGDFDFDTEEDFSLASPVSTPSKVSGKEEGEDYLNDSMLTASCSNCGSEVLKAEMQLHLQYCVDSDDETDLEASPLISKSYDPKNKSMLQHSSLNVDLVSCPSCMEKVKEECIQQHLDECLSFISEEF